MHGSFHSCLVLFKTHWWYNISPLQFQASDTHSSVNATLASHKLWSSDEAQLLVLPKSELLQSHYCSYQMYHLIVMTILKMCIGMWFNARYIASSPPRQTYLFFKKWTHYIYWINSCLFEPYNSEAAKQWNIKRFVIGITVGYLCHLAALRTIKAIFLTELTVKLPTEFIIS